MGVKQQFVVHAEGTHKNLAQNKSPLVFPAITNSRHKRVRAADAIILVATLHNGIFTMAKI